MKVVFDGKEDVLVLSRRLRVLWDIVSWLSGGLARTEESKLELSELQACALFFTSRTICLIRAICVLAQAGLAVEALSLCRVVLEAAIDFSYMVEAGGDMPKRWRLWRAYEEHRALKQLEGNIPTELDTWLEAERPRVEAAFEKAKGEMGPSWPTRNWAGNESLWARAKRTGLSLLHLRDYGLTSSLIHSGADSVPYSFREDKGECRVSLAMDYRNTDKALAMVTDAALAVVSSFNRVFELVAPERLTQRIHTWQLHSNRDSRLAT